MTKRQENLYKGYHVVTSSSGSAGPPFTANFGVARVLPDGTIGPLDTRPCKVTYQTEEEAHAAANVAAREFIDSMLAKK
mgnify:CR=1 FL=1